MPKNKTIVVPQHVLDSHNAAKAAAKKAPHIRIQYIEEPMSMEDIGGYLLDEIIGFNEAFNVYVDDNGFVKGDLTPADVTNIGYKLLAWVSVAKELEDAK